MSDKWNGESRGCSDVMVTRLQHIIRNYSVEREYEDVYTSVLSLVTHCEENSVKLTDVLEKAYTELKGEINE